MLMLSADGGGSKLDIIIFNENMEILGRGRSGGVNLTSTTVEDARANTIECVTAAFSTLGKHAAATSAATSAAGVADVASASSASSAASTASAASVTAIAGVADVVAVDVLFNQFMGPLDILTDAVNAYAPIREIRYIDEMQAGLVAGALWRDGFLALSGTGSDVFFEGNGLQPKTNMERVNVVGGWGPILGDDGSGTWIGCRAAQAAVAGYEGWGAPTSLFERILREWELSDPFGIIGVLYGCASPFRKAASLTRIVGEAARAGDAVASSILREAGLLMARQALCLISRYDVPPALQKMVCCGSAWKTHPAMYEAFSQEVLRVAPGFDLRKPLFEPVAAGPALCLLERGVPERDAAELLRKNLPEYMIKW